MKGRLFGSESDQGDPELMTYKAVRIIKVPSNSSACERQETCGQLQDCSGE